MPIEWSTPKTWETGTLVTASDLNTHLRDNLEALKNPPTVMHRFTPNPVVQITSTTFVDIDASLNFSLPTKGGALMIGLVGRVYHNPGTNTDCYFDININGASQGGTDGVLWLLGPNAYQLPFSVVWLTDPIEAGTQTVKIQCRRGSGNTNPVKIYDLFAWVREVS